MKLYQLQTLENGVITVIKFGSAEWAIREQIERLRVIQMEANPLTPYRLVENDNHQITEGNWQTNFSEDEAKMLNCKHDLTVVVGWASCPKCKWSELTAHSGLYKIEELNR